MSNPPNEPRDDAVESSTPRPTGSLRPLRIWPPLALLVGMVGFWFLPRVFDGLPVAWQMWSAVGPLVCGLLILVWWLLLSRATFKERGIGLLCVLLTFGATALLVDASMRVPAIPLFTIPIGTAAFAFGAILFSRVLTIRRTVAAVLFAGCGFGVSLLLQSEGMWGEFAALQLRWRWQPTHEERMLAQRANRPGREGLLVAKDEVDAWLAAPEWPSFRGADRSGRQQGPQISTQWRNSPPQEIWKISVGPGWSSFAVAGNLLFTQEQRGPLEETVCYDADSGREIWSQAVEKRFYESMGGPGPRATPTISDGKLFSMGASGDLIRLDPKSGDVAWQVDLQEVSNRKPPTWGFSSSPLVVDGNVVVHAGGDEDRGVLAFDVETGDLRWSAAAGDHSYSSPQLSTIAGVDMVLMLTNQGLHAFDPSTGEVRFTYDWPYQGYRVLQPQAVDGDSLLLATGMGVGTRRIRVVGEDGSFSTEDIWESRQLKPDFNDFVIHGDHTYGFDGGVFTCIDLKNGMRAWKGGRYGKGQVLLLEDSALLFVAGEQGEIVLLKADPGERQELARFQALEGKTWNHPVVVGDRLYVRNAQEAACYQLPLEGEAVAVNQRR